MLVLLAEDQISVKVTESGWAWMVCGERLIIWKICQTAVAKVQFCPSFTDRIHKAAIAVFQSKSLMLLRDTNNLHLYQIVEKSCKIF